MEIHNIHKRLRDFAEARNWQQFHSPKNLTMALAAEAAELLEIFQWLTEEQSKNITESEKDMSLIKQEIADVFIYLARLSPDTSSHMPASLIHYYLNYLIQTAFISQSVPDRLNLLILPNSLPI